MPKVLVIGVGNTLRKDDGVGPRVVQELSSRLPSRAEVDFLDGGTGGVSLLGYLDGYTHLVVIDAFDGGLPPGTICRLDPKDLRPTGTRALSLHQAGVTDLLLLAGLTGPPPKTVIFGIQAGCLDWGTELSPEVEAALGKLEELVKKELEVILKEPGGV